MMILKVSDQEAERRSKATLHRESMIAKYSAIHGIHRAFNDYHWWQEEIAVINANGDVSSQHHYDYPLPYCSKYFRRFVELFLSPHCDDYLLATLAHEFPAGDEVDADYIESLIRRANDYHLFKQGGVLGFDGDEAFTFFVLGPDEPLPRTGLIGHLSSDNIFFGSKTNKERVKAIRRWLKHQAKQITSPSSLINHPQLPERSAAPDDTIDQKRTVKSHSANTLYAATGPDVNTQDYETVRCQRQLEALLHDQLMVEKYCGEDQNPNDITLWRGEREIEGPNGQKKLLLYRDYPKPHSPLYFCYFLRRITDKSLSELMLWIKHEFADDVIDKNYVESLLVKAEELGLQIDNVCVATTEGTITSYPPPDPLDLEFLHNEDLARITGPDIFYGGEDFRKRADIVRGWCQDNASHLSGIPPVEAKAISAPALVKNNAQISASGPETPLPPIPARAGTPKMARIDEDLTTYFSWEFDKTHLDNLAKGVSLCPPSEEFKEVPKAPSRIWALVDAIKNVDKSESLSARSAQDLAEAFGRRYGYTVEKRLSKKSKNKTYQDSLKIILGIINGMKKTGNTK